MCVHRLLLGCCLLVFVDQGFGDMQVCINCGRSAMCDPFYQNITGVNAGQTCNSACDADFSCNHGVFEYSANTCSLSNCIYVKYSMASTAYRRTTNTECPVFSITYRRDATPISGTVHNPIWSEHECLALCLDTVNCRLVGFRNVNKTCTLSDGTATVYDPDSRIYVRDCTSGCNKIYTQSCHRCSTPWFTPAQLGEMTNILRPQECLTSALWTQAASVYYNPGSASCHYYDTGGVLPITNVAASKNVLRKTCYNDCLDFSMHEYNGFRGNCVSLATRGPDMYGNQKNCYAMCLDTPQCRGVNFINNNTCYYVTDDCDADIPMIPDPTYTYMSLQCVDLSAPITQTCNNCEIHGGCQAAFSTITVSSWGECHAQCEGSGDCTTATYDPASMQCLMYQCSAPQQSYSGLMSFRKTINTDCQVYEVYSAWQYQGTCDTMTVIKPLWNQIHCTELCLDTPGCRAMSHDWAAAVCKLHNSTCSDIVQQDDTVYRRKYCISDCATPTVQTCMNCKPENTCTGAHYISTNDVIQPFNIDTSPLISDDTVKQIWYNPTSRQYQYIDCAHIDRNGEDNHIVYRKSCSTACPKYEVFTMQDYRGTCTVIEHIYNDKSWQSCRSKCLDTDNCRGVTIRYDGTNNICLLHDCDDYTYDPGYYFTRRRCIDECPGATVTQECVGCTANDKCITYNNQTSVLRTEDCANMKNGDSDSSMSMYNRTSGTCKLYQCSWVNRRHFDIVLRDSCNTDCPRYEIFQMWNYMGTCDVISEDRGYWVTLEQCTARCLDMPSCRAMTYDLTDYYCTYHTCANKTLSPVPTSFTMKRCLDNEPPRIHDQTCVGCTPSNKCQTKVTRTSSVTGTECKASYDSDVNGYAYHYCPENRTCDVVDCSWIQQQDIMTNVVYRKSTTSDCPIYNVYLFGYHISTCPEIDRDYNTLSFEYCMNRCLDMDGCRAITYYGSSTDCSYHSCTSKQYDESYTNIYTMTRECLTEHVYHPTKVYTQTVRDSKSDCGSGINRETNIDSAYDCDTSCPDCDVIVYHSTSRSCTQHECELPHPLGEGRTLLRATNNSECHHVYMPVRQWHVPTCGPYMYQNGFKPSIQCIPYCLDDPMCLAVGLDLINSVCLFYDCASEFVPDAIVEYLIVKHCLYDCPTPVIQTCLNCIQGTICQPHFITAPMTDATAHSWCLGEESCEGMAYDTGLLMWKTFQCGRVQQQYNSMFYRKSCDNDCTVYEMYVVQGFGTCTEISNMTQNFISNPEVCYERCLDTFGCRGVTFNAGTCTYHTCDCFNQSTNGETFMWRYCLTDISNVTNLSDPTDNTMFPSVCNPITTTQAPTTSTIPASTTPAESTTFPDSTTPIETTTPEASTTTPDSTTPPDSTTIPVSTTSLSSTTLSASTSAPTTAFTTPASTGTSTVPTVSITAPALTTPSPASISPPVATPTVSSPSPPQVLPIFIMPCNCRVESFGNLSQDEIIESLIQNLTIDVESTSTFYRKLNSAVDDRSSSKAIGVAGVTIISIIGCLILIMDLPTLLKIFRRQPLHQPTVKSKQKTQFKDKQA